MSETSIANVSSDQSSSSEDVITTGLVSPVSDYVPLQTQSGAEQECQPWQATTDQQQIDHERKVAGVSDPQSDQPAASCECRFSNEEGKDPNSWWGKVFRDTDIKLTLKSLSGTRWSARAESTKALWKYYAQLREALNDMSKDMEEKCVTRSEASALCDKLDTLEMAFMAYFWDTILQRFQATSLQLQKHDIDICTATQLLLSLRDFVAAQRNNFEVFEGAALNVTTAVSQEYRHDLQRTKKRKIMSDDSAEPGVAFNGKDKFRIETFNVVIDKLVSCLNHRLNAYTQLTELFDVLFMPDNMSNRERSFSKVARIKNELRIRMRQNRLNSLSLLAIESDLGPLFAFKGFSIKR
ncbi:hypothetical protein SRHO_G00204090 [Serrasalmus rhombeus]